MKYIHPLLLLLIFALSGNASGGQTLQSTDYHTHRNPVSNSFANFKAEKTGRVAFLGGSITYNGGWRDSVCNFLQEQFPDTQFDFIAAGIPSMGSPAGAFRFERDVLKNGPVDLLFEEAAVNDQAIGHSEQEIKNAMEGIVRHAFHSNPNMDVIMMHFVDPGKMKEYRNRQIPRVIQLHEEIATHYNISTINLAKEVTDRIDNKEFDWENDFKNLHPSPFGQGVYARSMIAFLKTELSALKERNEIVKRKLPKKLSPACYDQGKLVLPTEEMASSGWELIPNWNPKDGKGTRANYINVPMLVGDYPSDILLFEFKGNAVGICVAAGQDAGIIEYRLDKGEWKRFDLFSKHSPNLHLPRYYTLASGLKKKKHNLQIRVLAEKNPKSAGTKCVIRYLYAN